MFLAANAAELRGLLDLKQIGSFVYRLERPSWTVTWHRMSSFAVQVSVCALLAVDLDNSKGGSGSGRFSKGHDVR